MWEDTLSGCATPLPSANLMNRCPPMISAGSQIWHERRHHDRLHQWLRQLIKDAGRNEAAEL